MKQAGHRLQGALATGKRTLPCDGRRYHEQPRPSWMLIEEAE